MSNQLAKLPQIRGQYRFASKIKNWFDVGGPAEILFRPADFADLQFFLKNLSPQIPLNVVGAASNVIIDDAGIAGMVIKLGAEFAEISHQKITTQPNQTGAATSTEIIRKDDPKDDPKDDLIENPNFLTVSTQAEPCRSKAQNFKKVDLQQPKDVFSKIQKPSFLIKAGGAALCANLAAYCQNHGIGGLEFLATIPGSIGGAIAMNAGCYGTEIADCLKEVQSLDFAGNSQVLTKADCKFSYRHNHLAKSFIFTAGTFYGFASSSEEVAGKIAEFKNNRELSQPIRAKTGGSTFKNPTIRSFQKIVETNLNQGLGLAEYKLENVVSDSRREAEILKRVPRTLSKSCFGESDMKHCQEPRTTPYKDIQREIGKLENDVEMAAKGRDFARVLKAWELIDAIGFRGKQIGGAKFSEKHCNFLINDGSAKASDLLALGEEARKKVKEKFGIELEWEIKHLR